MKKRLSLLVALVMAFTIFCIPGSSAAFAEGEEEQEVQAMAGPYTVSYDANGGSGAPEAQQKEEGISLMLSTDEPTRSGYIFTGWNTDENGSGASYAAGAEYSTDADVTLYAQWEPEAENITVTYDPNGGTGEPQAQTGKKGTSMTLSSTVPTWTNHAFLNWNTEKDGSGTSYAAGATYPGTATVTLYAQWQAYTVGKIVGNTKPYTTTKTSITVNWKILSTKKQYTVDKVVFYLNGKVKKTVTTSARSGSYTFSGLSDGTYYSFAVKPYYKGKTLTAWKGKALTKAPVQNGAYKPGKYEYYYVNGVKQRNKIIQFKDTRYGTSKYSLNHYYDASGVFRGRTKYMYKKIKNMSSKKYLICIDRTNNVMCVYIGGKGKWRPYKYWSCVTGRLKKSDYHPTPLGTYTIKSRKLTFSGYGIPEKMKNRYSVWYCSRFVGSVFIHSQLYHYGQKSGFIPGGGTMGRNASHGCVRLNINYAHWVYKNCAKGTKVVVIK